MRNDFCSFDRYEDKVNYFLYTHDEEDYSIECGDEYLELDPSIIRGVENRALADCSENRPERSPEQLGDYLLQAGLLPADRIKEVVYDLHVDYCLSYRAERARIFGKRRR